MGALIGIGKTLLSAVITKQVNNIAADGGLSKSAPTEISMTKAGASGMGAVALTMVDWAAAQAGDPAACGQFAALAVTWALTLYGRWRAERA